MQNPHRCQYDSDCGLNLKSRNAIDCGKSTIQNNARWDGRRNTRLSHRVATKSQPRLSGVFSRYSGLLLLPKVPQFKIKIMILNSVIAEAHIFHAAYINNQPYTEKKTQQVVNT